MLIISVGAKGADALGEKLASDYNLPLKIIQADWNKNGKRAGYVRNIDMAKAATSDPEDVGILFAFWDGHSRGTEHMISTAYKYHMKVYVFNQLEQEG